MFTTTKGSGPGLVTPENDEGIVTGQGDNPQNTTNFNASNFIANTLDVVNDSEFPRNWVFALLLVMSRIEMVS